MSINAILSLSSKLLVPALFVGYAVVANISFANQWSANSGSLMESFNALLNGEAASNLDTLYRKELPHRPAALGIVGALRYVTLREGRKGVIVGRQNWLFTDEEFEVPANPNTYIQTASRHIAEIRDTLAKDGIRLVVVPLPAKADIYREYLPESSLIDDMESRYEQFVAALSANDVYTVDTRTALLDTKSKDSVFLQTDTHWSWAGVNSVALAVAQALNPIDSETDFRIEDAGEIEIGGDLTRFISEPPYISMTGITTEKVTLHLAKSNTNNSGVIVDLFGNDEVFPIALVGTSYSANENWSFAEALKVAVNADVLNLAKEGLGPVTPMRDFLTGSLDRNDPPQVIIWEFPIRYLAQEDLWSPREQHPDVDATLVAEIAQ